MLLQYLLENIEQNEITMATKTKNWNTGTGSATIQYDGQGDGEIDIPDGMMKSGQNRKRQHQLACVVICHDPGRVYCSRMGKSPVTFPKTEESFTPRVLPLRVVRADLPLMVMLLALEGSGKIRSLSPASICS